MNAWEFVDALLEDAVNSRQSCVFPPAQAAKLREMIANIPMGELDGRKRKRAPRRKGTSTSRTISVPDDLFNKLENEATIRGISYSALVVEICESYVEGLLER